MAVLLLPMLMLFTGAQAQDFTYTTNNGTITITGYTGPGGNVTIPSVITGLPVTVIGDRAFSSLASLTGITIPSSVTNIGDAAFGQCNLTNVIIPDSVTYLGDAAFFACTSLASLTIGNGFTTIRGGGGRGMYGTFMGCNSLTRVTIPDSVTNISDGEVHLGGSLGAFYGCGLTNVIIGKGLAYLGTGAFNYCHNLPGVYFRGNAPTTGVSYFGADDIFHYSELVTVYYLPGRTGWGPTLAGVPAVLWNPQMQVSGDGSGGQQNGFGFNIAGTAGIPLVIEACTNLPAGSWVSLQSCTLTNGLLYFSDPQWTNYPGRFYRIRSP